jgi:diacylglycerol kinase (ATP)
MTTVAVVAHEGKTLGGGLGELRELLAREGFPEPIWVQVPKSKKAPKAARQAVADGADLLFVWGGDGTVQRCVDAVAGSGVALAVLPAGTANLLATNLGIPMDLEGAVRVGLHGVRRPLDTGTVNGEHFTVMAGTGFDAMMIKDADRGLKDRFGRLAYVWTGARNLQPSRARGTVTVDGRTFYRGTLSCVLVGNVGKVLGGLTVFDGARPDDGILELGVVTATSAVQWARTLGRTALGRPERSPYVRVALARRIRVDLDRPLPYELDGGDRPATKRLKIRVRPASVVVCVPG